MASGANKSKSPERNPKPEKSQEELRASLESKLTALESPLEQGAKEYQQALNEGLFEDKDGEPEGSGEIRQKEMQKKLTILLDRAEKMKFKLNSGETLKQLQEEIQVDYTKPDGKKETISLNIEAKLQDFLSFYQKTNIDVPADFVEIISDIWERNQTEIQKAVEQNGFDEMLIVPANIPLPDLAEKMKMQNGYWESSNFTSGGSFAHATSQNVDKPRIVLVHKTKELTDRPELKQTLTVKGQDVKLDQILTLEDYLVFQRKYFEETGEHLDNNNATWLATKSGARLVYSGWNPSSGELYVSAGDLDFQGSDLGARPSRSFF